MWFKAQYSQVLSVTTVQGLKLGDEHAMGVKLPPPTYVTSFMNAPLGASEIKIVLLKKNLVFKKCPI